MKLFIKIFYLFIFISFFSFPQNYRKVKIFLPDPLENIQQLAKFNINVEHSELTKDNGLIIFLNDDEFSRLGMLNFNYQVLIENWYEYFNNLPKLSESEKQNILAQNKMEFGITGFRFGSMAGFYTYQEVVNDLDSMYIKYPNLITQKFSIGTSTDGRQLWAVKISDNPNINEDEPQTMFDGLIHAREPQAMETNIYFMWYLLENYGTNPEVTYLVNNREIYFVPVVNPDGYEYNRSTNPNGGGMWRKNRRNNGDGSYGVDLNRNWAYKWGYDNIGSSPTPSSDTYRGPSPASEPETQVMNNYIKTKKIKTHINYHSYNNSIIYPWSYINALTPDSLEYIEFASYMSKHNGYDYGTVYQTLGYTSNGSARDWMYGEQATKIKTFSYVFEVGSSSDGFWPSQSRIIPLAQANVRPNLYQTWIAGEYISYNDAIFDKQYFNPGDNVQMFAKLKNEGLSTGFNISAQLSSLSQYITINSNSISVDSIQSRTTYVSPQAFNFSISQTAPAGAEVKLLLTTKTNNVEMNKDTIRLVIGVPTYAFIDTTNNPSLLWTITATPTASPKWEATTSTFNSPPNSYTDSKTGNYVSNATVTLTLTNSISLNEIVNPKLSFWTKYDFEARYDCGVVQISTNNGSTWSNLQGLYTEPASGQGKQVPTGSPVYNGSKFNWVKEEINLSAFASQSIKLRFELRSDGGVNKDGLYLDDIGILTYTIVPVELSSFTAKSKNSKVILNWTTASETNNKGFEIQKSKVSLPNETLRSKNLEWISLGFINGTGTTTERQAYSFEDNSVNAGKYLYRLKQIDYDGTVKIYEPIEVEVFSSFTFDLKQNYPNPFNPKTRIRYSIMKKENVILKVFDVFGKEVAVLVNEVKDAGEYEVEFNTQVTSSLPSGVYFYQLKSGNFVSTKKIILLK